MLRVDQPTSILTWTEPDGLAARGTLVVVPGRGERPSLYERFAARLAADAYRVHAVADPTAHEALARRQVDRVLDDAGELEPKILVGSDAGAVFAIGLVASGRVPGVAALVLAGLPGPGEESGESPDEGPGEGSGRAAVTVGAAAELDLRTACGTHLARLAGSALRRGALYEPVPAAWLAAADLAAVTVPVLGIHGAEDRISPLRAARERYAVAPAAELVSIAGGRHDALNDQAHRTVAATIVQFLERVRSGPGAGPIAHHERLGDG